MQNPTAMDLLRVMFLGRRRPSLNQGLLFGFRGRRFTECFAQFWGVGHEADINSISDLFQCFTKSWICLKFGDWRRRTQNRILHFVVELYKKRFRASTRNVGRTKGLYEFCWGRGFV